MRRINYLQLSSRIRKVPYKPYKTGIPAWYSDVRPAVAWEPWRLQTTRAKWKRFDLEEKEAYREQFFRHPVSEFVIIRDEMVKGTGGSGEMSQGLLLGQIRRYGIGIEGPISNVIKKDGLIELDLDNPGLAIADTMGKGRVVMLVRRMWYQIQLQVGDEPWEDYFGFPLELIQKFVPGRMKRRILMSSIVQAEGGSVPGVEPGRTPRNLPKYP